MPAIWLSPRAAEDEAAEPVPDADGEKPFLQEFWTSNEKTLIPLIAAAGGLLLLGIIGYYCYQRRKARRDLRYQQEEEDWIEDESRKPSYSVKDEDQAVTNGSGIDQYRAKQKDAIRVRLQQQTEDDYRSHSLFGKLKSALW